MTEGLALAGWTHVYAGKVRDLYIPVSAERLETADSLLMVASDRISAFDFMLNPPIPNKGRLLNQLTLWWLRQFPDVPNHVVSTDVPDEVAGRAVICKRLTMYPVECVVRGYLTGSGLAEYRESGTVCGIPLPAGLQDGSRLPEPIFTPAYKAPQGEHDENITWERTVELIGLQAAEAIRAASLDLYTRGAQIAHDRGLILADTKFEFGSDLGRLTLADEVLTSDSSRYWDLEGWQTGTSTLSFDKQVVRNWLNEHWDRAGEPPELPAELVHLTEQQYLTLFQRLTGLDSPAE